MSNGIQFAIKGTNEQFAQLEKMCQVSELLMASTLARRIEGLKAEEAEEFIISWFQSVRHMAHGAWITAGIQAQASPIGVPLQDGLKGAADENRAKAEHTSRMNRVVAALMEMGINLNPGQLEMLFNALK